MILSRDPVPRPAGAALADRIDAWLPQTQCTQCGYPRCREYAIAIAADTADIDQCPPGGETTIGGLARLLGVSPKPLNPAHGEHRARRRAVIDEARCIGCTKCIQACPVDAIVGARKLMHTVIASECNGCELCLPPCPVDCIDLVATAAPTDADPWPDYSRVEADRWRERSERRLQRLARLRPTTRRHARTSAATTPSRDRDRIRAEIRAAVERVRIKKQRRQD